MGSIDKNGDQVAVNGVVELDALVVGAGLYTLIPKYRILANPPGIM
jgi:hypothetical protein